MPKSDIVLITFPFTDLSGSKLRPAVVLIDSEFDLTVCFITTQLGWQEKDRCYARPQYNQQTSQAIHDQGQQDLHVGEIIGEGIVGAAYCQ